ncbi:DTX3L-like protein [Mya arenaria]|uniref:RING-type E3 ubiquitin transferase n=1 Tax=Mya arenaria TaxID=6604 RepID=A0ABY7FKQ9_MYAAR|nr:DTX3L-like protein [Mya arenaria]
MPPPTPEDDDASGATQETLPRGHSNSQGKGLAQHRGNDPLQPERTECVSNVEHELDDGCKENQNPMDESGAKNNTLDLPYRNKAHAAADSENNSSENVVSSDGAPKKQAVEIEQGSYTGESNKSKESQAHSSGKKKTNGTYTFWKDDDQWCILDAKSNNVLTVLEFKADDIYFKGKKIVVVDGVNHTIIEENGAVKLQIVFTQSSLSKKNDQQLLQSTAKSSLSKSAESIPTDSKPFTDTYGKKRMNVYCCFPEKWECIDCKDLKKHVDFRKEKIDQCQKLKTLIKQCLSIAELEGYKTIAFPAVGTGNLLYPMKEVSKALMESALEFREENVCCSLDMVFEETFEKIRQPPPRPPPPKCRDHKFGALLVDVKIGEVSEFVTSEDSIVYIWDSSEVEKATLKNHSFLQTCGNQMYSDWEKQVKQERQTCVVTGAGNLPANHVIHITKKGHEEIEKCIRRGLTKAKEYNCKHVKMIFDECLMEGGNFAREYLCTLATIASDLRSNIHVSIIINAHFVTEFVYAFNTGQPLLRTEFLLIGEESNLKKAKDTLQKLVSKDMPTVIPELHEPAVQEIDRRCIEANDVVKRKTLNGLHFSKIPNETLLQKRILCQADIDVEFLDLLDVETVDDEEGKRWIQTRTEYQYQVILEKIKTKTSQTHEQKASEFSNIETVSDVSEQLYELFKNKKETEIQDFESQKGLLTYNLKESLLTIEFENSSDMSSRFDSFKIFLDDVKQMEIGELVADEDSSKVRRWCSEIDEAMKYECCAYICEGNKVITFCKDYNDIVKVKKLLELKQNKRQIKQTGRNRTRQKDEASDANVLDEQKEIPLNRSHRTRSNLENLKIFSTREGIQIMIYKASLLDAKVDCIVNAANEHLSHGAGVAFAIAKKAGRELEEDGNAKVKKDGKIPVGKVVCTKAGRLPYNCVIHAVGPRWSNYEVETLSGVHQCAEDLRSALNESFSAALNKGNKTIALPAISSAIFGVPKDLCCLQYVQAVLDHSKKYQNPLHEIHFVDIDGNTVKNIQDTFESVLQNGTYPCRLEDFTNADHCVICMDDVTEPKTLPCGHIFCTECIDGYFKTGKQVCPTCFREQHSNPGAWYKGITRTAYLPDNREGKTVCRLLKEAFRRRLIFTIGRSRTTGQEGVITWNDIHHKTDHRPNTQFGYPDSTYLARVTEELAAKGVTEEQINTKEQIDDYIEL